MTAKAQIPLQVRLLRSALRKLIEQMHKEGVYPDKYTVFESAEREMHRAYGTWSPLSRGRIPK